MALSSHTLLINKMMAVSSAYARIALRKTLMIRSLGYAKR